MKYIEWVKTRWEVFIKLFRSWTQDYLPGHLSHDQSIGQAVIFSTGFFDLILSNIEKDLYSLYMIFLHLLITSDNALHIDVGGNQLIITQYEELLRYTYGP